MNKNEEKNTVKAKSTTKKYGFEKPLAKGQTLKALEELERSQDPMVALNAKYQREYLFLCERYEHALEAAELEKYILECKNLQLYIEDAQNFRSIGALLLMNSNYTRYVETKLIVNCRYYLTEEFNKSTAKRLCFSEIHREVPDLCDDEIIISTKDHNAVDELKNGLYFYSVNVHDECYKNDTRRDIYYQIIEEGRVIKEGNYSAMTKCSRGIVPMIDKKIKNIQQQEQIKEQSIATKKSKPTQKKASSSIFDEVDELFI